MSSSSLVPDSPFRVDIAKPVPKRVIRALAKLIAEKFDPDKIVLFGSHAYGRPTPWSDVDLLVVMETPKDPLEHALEIRMALPPRSFGLDLLVRSQTEIERRIIIHDWFLIEITTKGKVLYERNNGRVGVQGRKRLRHRPSSNGKKRKRTAHH
ncbi:MAG: nucleotidyltransferase domain-containing protein [Chloroflexi bacterium]|nr:nucleotidyltransferase domain-containing protein [Chloroflexota bacterium]MBI3761725.1 nucleotidyltransferase domain-containing protein [Chloroflexota bacterium]